jgi:hypothetical protein
MVLAVSLSSCALESDDVELDDAAGDLTPADDDLGLWTGVPAPPYDAAGLALSHEVFELKPAARGDITLTASLRWRHRSAGAIDPQLSFGLVTSEGESTLLQIFENGGALQTRFDLEMTDALQIGAWYRVALTIADAPGRPVQVRIFDDAGAEVWRSCREGGCPSTSIDPGALEDVRLNVTVVDARNGNGHIEIRDLSLDPNP